MKTPQVFFLAAILILCSCDCNIDPVFEWKTPRLKKPEPPPRPGTSALIIRGPLIRTPKCEYSAGEAIRWSSLGSSGNYSVRLELTEKANKPQIDARGEGQVFLENVLRPMRSWRFQQCCKGWIKYDFTLGRGRPPYLTITGNLEKTSAYQQFIVEPGLMYNIAGYESAYINDSGLIFSSN